jgi:hypothetical protein
LYRGQILLALAVGFVGVGALDLWLYFGPLVYRQDHLEVFLLLIGGAFSIILGLVLFAMSAVAWVPKWERDEKRTGHIPGDGRKK